LQLLFIATGAQLARRIPLEGSEARGVIYGILGTAIVQGVLAAVGLYLAGVPGPVFLGLLTFFLSPLPVGPPLVWIPASIWLFANGHTAWGFFMLGWGLLVVSSVDNIVRPYLISKGNRMPFIVIFFGVIGGVLAFGFIGLVVGPIVLVTAGNLLRLSSRPQPFAARPAIEIGAVKK
jgi:predicted PurR-regulated permease PerM